MENYKIIITASAEKTLLKLPNKDLKRVTEAIQTLAINPTPIGCRKLMGDESAFRIRQGNYRIIYEIYEQKITILILKIGHRKDVYKK